MKKLSTAACVTLSVAAAAANHGVIAPAGVAVSTCAAITSPAPCGQPTDSQTQCLAKGCCWNDAFSDTPCFYAGGDAVPIDTVHVVQSAHVDLGFNNLTVRMLDQYFTHHIPTAIWLGAQLEQLANANAASQANASTPSLKFMSQSWIMDMYVNCPPGAGLPCPSAEALANFSMAVEKGWITWHALPFNAELELMDPAMLAFSVDLTHALDDFFHQPRKATMSQRDVPGITRSAIPHLLASGVRAITVGVNGASTPPTVPRAFIWKDPVSNASIPAMWHPYGYGGINISDAVILPGLSHALVFDWRSDNAGPPTSVQEVLDDWASLNSTFPGAKIVASTLDDWLPYLYTSMDKLPVITTEIGDTWIHGAQSDPQKTARYKRGLAIRTECLASGACHIEDPAFRNFSRFWIKNAEHTWGCDIKTYLHDTTNWSNDQLRASWGSPNFQYAMYSWQEQRNWGFEYAIEALPEGHPLRQPILDAMNSVYPAPPPTPTAPTWSPVAPGAQMTAGRFSFSLDPKTGAFATLVDTTSQQVWADATRGALLGFLEYHTYDESDYNTFIADYAAISPIPEWFYLDFGKPNVSLAGPVHQELVATATGIWSSKDANALHIVESLSIVNGNGNEPHTKYGAPGAIWVQLDVPTDAADGRINITLAIYNKTSTRLPEALFYRFNVSNAFGPSVAGPMSTVQWYADKLREWVNPFDVQRCGNQHHHAVGLAGLMATKADPAGKQPNATIYISSPDVHLVTFGKPFGLPTPTNVTADPLQGSGYYLLNNLWGTNYPAWLPWADGDENIQFTFQIAV